MPLTIHRSNYRPPQFAIDHVDLSIDLSFTKCTIEANLDFSKIVGVPNVPLTLNSKFHKIRQVAINNRQLTSDEYSINKSNDLIIHPSTIEGLTSFKLSTVVEFDPSTNFALEGIYKSGPIICSQCEAHGFRRITPFLDRPDVLSTYKVRIEADQTDMPVLLCNGNKINFGTLPNNKHFVVYVDPFPKPCSLFAVVAGPLQQISAVHIRPPAPGEPTGRPVQLNIWADACDVPKLDWAMESLKKAMVWDEQRYGRVYDLDVFNLVSTEFFNFGAMENKSLNIFNSRRLLAHKDFSTDSEFETILDVVGHEYFHNWTGNRVSCRDWFQITLKEGLTVHRADEFIRDFMSAGAMRINQTIALRTLQFPEDASRLCHSIRPESYEVVDNFYTSTVYRKGAAVVRMFQTILGIDGFRRGMDLYFDRHDRHGVTCDDFRAAMADANKINFDQFERWYIQCGTPQLVVEKAQWDNENKIFQIRIRQHTPTNPKNLPHHLPVSMALFGRTSKSAIPGTIVVKELREEVEDWEFRADEDCVLSLLRDFSAPVTLEFDQSDEDLAFLMSHETDGFARWEAGTKLWTRHINTNAMRLAKGETLQSPSTSIVEAFRKVLCSTTSDQGCQAASLCLPTIDLLMNACRGDCLPNLIAKARRHARKELGQIFRPEFERLYRETSRTTWDIPYVISPTDVGLRCLRNVCLWYLCSEESGAFIAFQQYINATNMTERMGGLECLCSMKSTYRDLALGHFRKLAQDSNRLDKWFAVQAAADLDDIHTHVHYLEAHPDFDLKSPNRMNSIIRSFAENRGHFHCPSGRGYRWISALIIQIDHHNPSVAARLTTELCKFSGLDVSLKNMMLKELKVIVGRKECSPSVAELCRKSLGVEV